MENVEKMQEVSPENVVETPEKVQQEAESSTKEQDETAQSDPADVESNPSLPEETDSGQEEDSPPMAGSDEVIPEEIPEPEASSEAEETPKEELKPETASDEETVVAEVKVEEGDLAQTEDSPSTTDLEEVTPAAIKEPETSNEVEETLEEETKPETASSEEIVNSEAQVGDSDLAKTEDSPSEIKSDEVTTEEIKEPVASKEANEFVKEETKSETASSEEATDIEEEVQVEEKPSVEPEAKTNDVGKGAEANSEETADTLIKEEEQEEEEDLDFSESSKEDLVKKIREVIKEERIPRIDRALKALKPRFDELFFAVQNEAKKKFEADGNDPDSFEYHGDEHDKEFNSLYSELKSRRNRHYRELENQKEDNLKKKEQLLEALRELVDGEESSDSINQVKEIQASWKSTGPVPGAQNKTLWANYNALLDRYYDQRGIYFELKDLDRKKNLKIKEEICARAEALASHEDLKIAIVQLNELHEEYKHAGSVPRSDQERLWTRFKTASDAVYVKRKEHFDQLKVEFEGNFEKKLVLAQEAEGFVEFSSESISDWNKKTKEIQSLQKKWEEIGGLPRDKAKVINKQFWGSFKKFFGAKNQFFKGMESKRDENLAQKEELIQQAVELKESSDWGATTQKYKNLQEQWKEIGPVPEKVRNEVYRRFKLECDHFFNRRREENSEQEKGYEDNLKLKLQICDQIEAIADKDEINLDDVYDLIGNHGQLGFVPRNAIKKEQARFQEATQKIVDLEDLKASDKDDLLHHIRNSKSRRFTGGGGGGKPAQPVAEQRHQRKEHSAKRKISELESDISTWNTNMEFFAASVTADKLKADLQMKINAAEEELKELKSQLS